MQLIIAKISEIHDQLKHLFIICLRDSPEKK